MIRNPLLISYINGLSLAFLSRRSKIILFTLVWTARLLLLPTIIHVII